MEFGELGREIENHEPSKEEQERILGLSKREQLIEKCERLNKNLKPIFDGEKYHCEKCNDSGSYYELEKFEFMLSNGDLYNNECIVAKICECVKVRESLKSLENSGMTEKMKRETFESYRTDENWQKVIKEKAIKFLDSEESCFYIGGYTGSGKTKICSCILNKYIERKRAIKYLVWRDFTTDLMENIENSNKLIREAQTIDVLYIDDLYKFPPKDFEKRVLYSIINYRVNKGLKTLISSETKLKNSDAKEQYKYEDMINIDLAVAGRIWENAGNGEFVIAIANDPKYNMRFKKKGW